MPYEPITRLPEDVARLEFIELRGLEKLWRSRRGDMEADGRLDAFLGRLAREWAIETGIIERLYHWDRGMTVLLVEQGIDASLIASGTALGRDRAEHVRDLILDQQAVVEGLFDFVASRRPLSESYIREMHAAFTRHQATTRAVDSLGRSVDVPLLRGAYKQQPNNPTRSDGTVHEFALPLHVPDEMERLVAWYGDLAQVDGSVPPEVLSAWLHHRLTQIHPFQDGNGRVARALASIAFVRAELFPLLIRDEDRASYIGALEIADGGDLAPLCRLFGERQRAAVLSALESARVVTNAPRLEALLRGLDDALRNKKSEPSRAIRTVEVNLLPLAEQRFNDIAVRIHSIESQTQTIRRSKVGDARHWRNVVLQLVGDDFQPDFAIHSSWIQLMLRARDEEDNLMIHFQGDRRFGSDILTAAAFIFGPRVGWAPLRRASSEVFHIPATEDSEVTELRFGEWVDEVLVVGLEEWRRVLVG